MFGMSGTEIFIILVIGIVIVGPKKLPAMMRTAGRWIAQMRRMTTEVRANSGIDKLIREEGLENEIREISSLTKSNMLSSLVTAPLAGPQRTIGALAKSALLATTPSPSTSTASPAKVTPLIEKSATSSTASSTATTPATAGSPSSAALGLIKPATNTVSRKNNDEALRALLAGGLFGARDREWPTIGCDAYDVIPDDIDDPEAYADDPDAPAEAAAATEASKEDAPAPPAATLASESSEPKAEPLEGSA